MSFPCLDIGYGLGGLRSDVVGSNLEIDVALGLLTCNHTAGLHLYSSHVLLVMCSFIAPLSVA
jgi:hypothetical protein